MASANGTGGAGMISLVTNVSLADAQIIRHTIPNWLRVLGGRVSEVVIVADFQPPSGRIAALHGDAAGPEALRRELAALQRHDPRVRTVEFDPARDPAALADRWFRGAVPVRCQGGTPISAMLLAIDSGRSPVVLRADSDMLFAGSEWLGEAESLLRSGAADLVEPPRFGMDQGRVPDVVSTRALLLMPALFAARLPMRAHKVGWTRRLHRRLARRSTWLSLEEMLQRERLASRLRHHILANRPGSFSIHAWNREYARRPAFAEIVARIEAGQVPEGQPAGDWNLVLGEENTVHARS